MTCLVDLMRPGIGFATLQLLENAGCEVQVPRGQTCCGQPTFNSGELEGSRALALKVLEEFEAYDHVVVPSGSCGAMLKKHYPQMFVAGSPERARLEALASRTHELTTFLVDVLNIDPASVVSASAEGVATYHDCCSGLRELGVKMQPRQLLAGCGQLAVREMQTPEACCGFGGAFSLKFGDISSAIADRKCADIEQTGAVMVVMGDLGCMLHLEGRLHRRGSSAIKVRHISEVLAEGGRQGRSD